MSVEGGYYIQRSGWGQETTRFKDERFLVFDCGPLGDGGHGHYDALSIEVAAEGRPLIVDPGRYTYHEGTPNWRHWFKGTAAHNTVCVDGLDQTPYRPGKPKGKLAEAQFIERMTAPRFDLLCGRAISPSYEAGHKRFVFFIADEYWVIVDQLRGERPHNFDLRFHLAPEAMNHTVIKNEVENSVVVAPGIALVLAAAAKPRLEPGWFAPQYGQKLPAPVVSVQVDAVASTNFFTVVTPLKLNDPPPSLRVLTEQVGRISFEVSGIGRNRSEMDRVIWSADHELLNLGPVKGMARASWLRTSASGEDALLTACAVKNIESSCVLTATLRSDAAEKDWVIWNKLQSFTHLVGGKQ